MTLSRNRSNVQIKKIQFTHDVCLKKFTFSTSTPKIKAKLSQNEHQDSNNEYFKSFIYIYVPTYSLTFNKFIVLLNKSEFSKLQTENSQLYPKAFRK